MKGIFTQAYSKTGWMCFIVLSLSGFVHKSLYRLEFVNIAINSPGNSLVHH